MKSVEPITVYYDGSCPICQKEICHYKKISTTQNIIWHDISKDTDCLKNIGISQVEALKWLYSKDQNGAVLRGLDSFILIWRQLERWRILSYLVSCPGIKQVLQAAYYLFANWRFKKRGYNRLSENKDTDDCPK